LAVALGKPTDAIGFVDLERTDSAFERLLVRRQSLEERTAWADLLVHVRAERVEPVRHGLQALAHALTGELMLLHRALSEFCGAVEVEGDDLIAHAFELLELDQEGVTASRESGDAGLILEHVTDPIGSGIPTYRLLGWSGWHDGRGSRS